MITGKQGIFERPGPIANDPRASIIYCTKLRIMVMYYV